MSQLLREVELKRQRMERLAIDEAGVSSKAKRQGKVGIKTM